MHVRWLVAVLVAAAALAAVAAAQFEGMSNEDIQRMVLEAQAKQSNNGFSEEQLEAIRNAVKREESAKSAPKPTPKPSKAPTPKPKAPRPPPPPPPPPLLQLNDTTFESMAINTTDVVVVLFTADECDSCEPLKAMVAALEPTMGGLVRFAFAHAATSPKTFQSYGVGGAPMLKMFGEMMLNPYRAGKTFKRPIEYDSNEATGKAIADWVLRAYPDLVVRLNATSERTLYAAPIAAAPRLIVFSLKPEVATLVRFLAAQFKARAVVAFVHVAAEPALAARFGVDANGLSATTAVLVPGESTYENAPTRAVRLDGPANRERLTALIATHAPAKPIVEKPSPSASAAGAAGNGAAGSSPSEPDDGGVLTAANFDARVIAPERDALVEFFASSDATYTTGKTGNALRLKLRAKLAHIVDVFAVDVEREPELAAKYKITLPPVGASAESDAPRVALRAFVHDMKRTPVPVTVPRKLDALFDYATKLLPSYTVRLSPASAPNFFQMELSKFKAILIVKSHEPNPLFSALARDLRDSMYFAEIPHTATELIDAIQKGLKEFPTLVVAGAIQSEDAGLQFALYHGPFEYAPVRAYLERFVRLQAERVAAREGRRPGAAGAGAAGVPAPAQLLGDITYVRTASEMDSACTGKLGLCVLMIVDPDEPNDAMRYRALLRALAGRFTGQKATHFVWTGKHLPVLDAYNVGFGYPAFVLISGSKKRYTTHVGAVELDAIADTIVQVRAGKIATAPVARWPALPEVAEPTDLYDEAADRAAAARLDVADEWASDDDDAGDDDESEPSEEVKAALAALNRKREL